MAKKRKSKAGEPIVIPNSVVKDRFFKGEGPGHIQISVSAGTSSDYQSVSPENYRDCLGCGDTHLKKNMINVLCSECQWECPQCEEISLKPERDYICQACRYGSTEQ